MDIPRPTKTCAVSQRNFSPEEPFFSVLTGEDGLFIRKDIAAEHWTGPPKDFFGWWRSTAKYVASNPSPQQVSGETLQSLFERLTSQPSEADTLYILTLLMLRRKLLRYERERTDAEGKRFVEVFSFNTNFTYQIPTAMPNLERLEVIQQTLATLTNEP